MIQISKDYQGDNFYIHLFSIWLDDLISLQEHQEEKQEVREFMKWAGCTETAPLTLMFKGFRAGVIYGTAFTDIKGVE